MIRINNSVAEYLFTAALDDCKNELEQLAQSTVIDGTQYPIDSRDFENSLNNVLGCDVRFHCTGAQCHLWIGKNECIDMNAPLWVRRILGRA